MGGMDRARESNDPFLGPARPYHAQVVFMGRERQTMAPHQIGDCNGCHTSSGDLAASGRIVLPYGRTLCTPNAMVRWTTLRRYQALPA